MTFHTTDLSDLSLLPLAQSPAFGAALTHIGRPPLRLSLRGGLGEVQIVRRRIGRLGAGLISRRDVPRRDLRRIARAAEIGVLLLNPDTPAGAHGAALQTPAHIAELDLAQSEDALRAGLKQKWRNRLVKAERTGLKVAETSLGPDQAHWIFSREAQQSRSRGYVNWSEGLTRAYASANRGQVRLFEARLSGEPIAAMVFLCHGAVASYHMGWTGEEGRMACAHNLLMWRATQALRARGVVRLDLGSVATDRAPGLARFKLGTGARLRKLGGSWLVFPRLLGVTQT